ncbi:MAG: hypothetical protein H5U10_09875 [Desulfacinum sp.]|nr:hypothetical protein [Desulfacinum sp.]
MKTGTLIGTLLLCLPMFFSPRTRAGELRPYQLPSQQYQGPYRQSPVQSLPTPSTAPSPREPQVDPQVYEDFRNHALRLTPEQREDLRRALATKLEQAKRRGTPAEVRHYETLLGILQTTSP